MTATLRSPLLQQLQQQLMFRPDSRAADAAVLVALTNESEPRVLLTRRAADMRQHAGEVSFPGGKRDPEDTDNIMTALREAWEETALPMDQVNLLGALPRERARSGQLVKPVVGVIEADLPLIAQPSEIERIFYLPLHSVMESAYEPHGIVWQGQMVYFPSLRHDGEIIWGLTARILMSLLQHGLGIERDWPFILTPSNVT